MSVSAKETKKRRPKHCHRLICIKFIKQGNLIKVHKRTRRNRKAITLHISSVCIGTAGRLLIFHDFFINCLLLVTDSRFFNWFV